MISLFETIETVANATENIQANPQESKTETSTSEISTIKEAANDVSNVENAESVELAGESNSKAKIENVQQEIPINEFTDDLLLENDDLFAKADEINVCEAQQTDIVAKSSSDVPLASEKVTGDDDIEMIENADSTLPAPHVDDIEKSVSIAPLEISDEKLDEIATETSKDDTEKGTTDCAVDEKKSTEDTKISDDIVQIIDDDNSREIGVQNESEKTAPNTAIDALENDKVSEQTDEKSIEPSLNGDQASEAESVTENKMVIDEPAPEEKVVAARRECLNLECSKESDTFYLASEFIINHFHLSKRPKLTYVCEPCHDSVTGNFLQFLSFFLPLTIAK